MEDQISAFLDGSPMFAVTDSRLDAGALLFLVRSHTTILFDNVGVPETQ